jgi:hypothetical protein
MIETGQNRGIRDITGNPVIKKFAIGARTNLQELVDLTARNDRVIDAQSLSIEIMRLVISESGQLPPNGESVRIPGYRWNWDFTVNPTAAQGEVSLSLRRAHVTDTQGYLTEEVVLQMEADAEFRQPGSLESVTVYKDADIQYKRLESKFQNPETLSSSTFRRRGLEKDPATVLAGTIVQDFGSDLRKRAETSFSSR